MSELLEAARTALRERQGSGARYDAESAPARELDWARRGTAYFAHKLNELSDIDLDVPSAIPGLSRRHIVAHVGYHARILSEIVAWVRTGQSGAFPRPAEVSKSDVELALTLPARALRYLFHHSEVHLNVEWRDLSDADWDVRVEDAVGRVVSLRETPEARACALWLHAVDLNSGARFSDMPPDFIDALVRHYATRMSGKVTFSLAPSDRPERLVVGNAPDVTVSGQATDIAKWLSGRGAKRLQVAGGPLPAAEFRATNLIRI